MHTIKYFMWGLQTDFRISAKVAAESLFSELDKNLVPDVFLIGVLDEDREDRHPICLEPEECGYEVSQFSDAKEQARLMQTHPTAQENYKQWQRLSNLRNAVLRVVSRNDEYPGVVSHCSRPTLVGGYQVMVVLQFSRDAFFSHYSLVKKARDGFLFLTTSFLNATIIEYLNLCSEALKKPDPGMQAIDRGYEEIIRAAGKRLMYTPVYAGAGVYEGFWGLFEACNVISSLKYEGEEGTGKMLIARREHPNVEVAVALTQPVRMSDYRAARKLLEISTGELSLLSDSGYIYGLGKTVGQYDRSEEDLFLVRFVRHYTWELLHDKYLMMQVQYGQPELPKEENYQPEFETYVKQIFSNINPEEITRLWDLTQEATKQKHGTMVVISAGAKEEAYRLKNQATVIKPIQLTSQIMKAITAIDGAVLIDPSSTCHGIGVILDGLATKKGDPSRGARYNSAVRYVETSKHCCLVIVVSEDGSIDLVPVKQE